MVNPGPGLADPGELSAFGAGDREVHEAQIADYLAHGLTLIVDQGVVTLGVSPAYLADRFTAGALEFGDVFPGVRD